MVFRNAFVVNALCLPSRASILTGLYSHTTGAVDNRDRPIPPAAPVISDLLRAAGYDVAFIGKSHVKGSLRDRYWDYYFGFDGQAEYYSPTITEGVRGVFGQPKKYDGNYVEDLLLEKALNYLNQPHDRPFCLFLWFYAPHAPFYRPRRLLDLYNGVPIPKPATFDDDLKGYLGKPRAFVEARNKIGTTEMEDDARSLEELVKDHYAGVVSNDEAVGKVVQVLEDKHALDDTAILFSSDHGFFLGEWRIFDKRFMHEPSIRVPLIIRYPRMIRPGTSIGQMALNLDLAPSILELAGIPIPIAMQGKSLVPFLNGETPVDWRKDWLYEYYEFPEDEHVPPHRGVRSDRYKLIHYYTMVPQEYELYDLQVDPGERNNLWAESAYNRLSEQLLTRIDELRKQTGDHLPDTIT
jgi:arylsulfatase A-like enzyme